MLNKKFVFLSALLLTSLSCDKGNSYRLPCKSDADCKDGGFVCSNYGSEAVGLCIDPEGDDRDTPFTSCGNDRYDDVEACFQPALALTLPTLYQPHFFYLTDMNDDGMKDLVMSGNGDHVVTAMANNPAIFQTPLEAIGAEDCPEYSADAAPVGPGGGSADPGHDDVALISNRDTPPGGDCLAEWGLRVYRNTSNGTGLTEKVAVARADKAVLTDECETDYPEDTTRLLGLAAGKLTGGVQQDFVITRACDVFEDDYAFMALLIVTTSDVDGDLVLSDVFELGEAAQQDLDSRTTRPLLAQLGDPAVGNDDILVPTPNGLAFLTGSEGGGYVESDMRILQPGNGVVARVGDVAVGKINGQPGNDIVYSYGEGFAFVSVSSDGPGTPDAPQVQETEDCEAGPIATGDVNGDDVDDVIVACIDRPAIQVYVSLDTKLERSEVTFAPHVELTGPGGLENTEDVTLTDLWAEDLDGDGRAEILTQAGRDDLNRSDQLWIFLSDN